MRHRALALIILSMLSCLRLPTANSSSPRDRANYMSLIRLIANPKTFDGRHLRLAGYLYYNGVDRAIGLYVTELDARNFIISNSVDLNLEESGVAKVLGKYVVLEGTYHAPQGVLADYMNGHLDQISQLKPLAQGDIPQ
jgi:hypothetical protein